MHPAMGGLPSNSTKNPIAPFLNYALLWITTISHTCFQISLYVAPPPKVSPPQQPERSFQNGNWSYHFVLNDP